MKWENFTCIFYKNNQEIYINNYENQSKNQQELTFFILEYETTINLEKETLLRENSEYLFFLDIKNKECKIELKQENINFDVEVEEASIKKEENKIIVEYFIETDEARNKIVIERNI